MSSNRTLETPVLDCLLRTRTSPTASSPLKLFPLTEKSIANRSNKINKRYVQISVITALCLVMGYLNEKVAMLQLDIHRLQATITTLQSTVQTQSLLKVHLQRHLKSSSKIIRPEN